MTDTNFILGAGNNFVTSDKQGQPGGVDILDYQSRVKYGCRLLAYSEQQGCTP
jgi:filamentous hemagglutinin